MTAPYLIRLAFMSLAALIVVQFGVGVIVTMLAPRAIRSSLRLRPSLAARRLLILRLAPAGVAIFVVIFFCIPSYLWLEPFAVEQVDLPCFGLAALALAAWGFSSARAARGWHDSVRYLRACRSAGRETSLLPNHAPVWLTDHAGPAVALAGILRPQVVVSRAAAGALTPQQLDAALLHERAHAQSRDNLKRLVMLLAPSVLPLHRASAAVEAAWRRSAECAADDRAVAGDPLRALSLAEALLRVSRLEHEAYLPSLVTCLSTPGDHHLSTRVDRLLNPAQTSAVLPRRIPRPLSMAFSVGLLTTLLAPSSLRVIHRLLERLI